MKFYHSEVDPCSGFKTISILTFDNGRSLLGMYYGYISIFYRIFYTQYQIVNKESLTEAIDHCNIDELILKKLDAFLNRDLSISEYIYYNYILKLKLLIKNFKSYRKEISRPI